MGRKEVGASVVDRFRLKDMRCDVSLQSVDDLDRACAVSEIIGED